MDLGILAQIDVFDAAELEKAGLPLYKVILAIVVVTLALILKKIFASTIIKYFEDLTSQTKTELDDELIAIIKQPLNWLIVLGGISLAKLVLITELNPVFNETLDNLINLSAIALVGWLVFRASPLLGEALGHLALKTETELDDIIVPYLPKVFQAIAIAVVLLKTSEILLGASAGALIGLIGGTGITLGLLLKDIVYDWFCTVVIFSDRLFSIDDILKVEGIDKLVQVKKIGVRSTTLCILSENALKKIPNSKMITGIVENWSQNPQQQELLGIDITLQIDDITSAQTGRICNTIRRFPQEIEHLNDRFTVWFSGINQNARTIKIQAFAEVNDLKSYRAVYSAVNLNILQVMEQEGIELFSSTPIAILPSEAPKEVPEKLVV